MEQDSTKNRVALAKSNRVSKKNNKNCYSQVKYKGSNKKYYSFIILVMPTKNESINLKLPKHWSEEK